MPYEVLISTRAWSHSGATSALAAVVLAKPWKKRY